MPSVLRKHGVIQELWRDPPKGSTQIGQVLAIDNMARVCDSEVNETNVEIIVYQDVVLQLIV